MSFHLVIVFIRHCSLMHNNVKNNRLLINSILMRNMKRVRRDVWHKNCIASLFYYSHKINSLRTEEKRLIYNQTKHYLWPASEKREPKITLESILHTGVLMGNVLSSRTKKLNSCYCNFETWNLVSLSKNLGGRS